MHEFTTTTLRVALGVTHDLWLESLALYGSEHPREVRWRRQAEMIEIVLERRLAAQAAREND